MKKIIGLFVFAFFSLAIAKGQMFEEALKTISVPSTIGIGDCMLLHKEYCDVRRCVMYEKHIISLVSGGGLIAISEELEVFDSVLTKELNSDFIHDLNVFHDTLFSKQFGGEFYFDCSKRKWISYNSNYNFSIYDVIYEDDEYEFISEDYGEWGGELWINDLSSNRQFKTGLGTAATSIFKEDGSYYIHCYCGHLSGSSTFFKILSIDSLELVVPSSEPEFKLLGSQNILKDVLLKPIGLTWPQLLINSCIIDNRRVFFYNHDIYETNMRNSQRKTYMSYQNGNALKAFDSLSQEYDLTYLRDWGKLKMSRNLTILKGNKITKVIFKSKKNYYRKKNVLVLNGVSILGIRNFSRYWKDSLRVDFKADLGRFGEIRRKRVPMESSRSEYPFYLNTLEGKKYHLLKSVYSGLAYGSADFIALDNNNSKVYIETWNGLLEIYDFEKFKSHYCKLIK